MPGLTHDDLRVCLAAMPPVELLGMTLLRQGSPQLLPSDILRDVLREAVTEIIAYTGRCAAGANRLSNLVPNWFSGEWRRVWSEVCAWITVLGTEIKQLKETVEKLQGIVKRNLQNSSQPP